MSTNEFAAEDNLLWNYSSQMKQGLPKEQNSNDHIVALLMRTQTKKSREPKTDPWVTSNLENDIIFKYSAYALYLIF